MSFRQNKACPVIVAKPGYNGGLAPPDKFLTAPLS